jgi:hypothetical protein
MLNIADSRQSVTQRKSIGIALDSDSTIQVYCRVRPPNQLEVAKGKGTCVEMQAGRPDNCRFVPSKEMLGTE